MNTPKGNNEQVSSEAVTTHTQVTGSESKLMGLGETDAGQDRHTETLATQAKHSAPDKQPPSIRPSVQEPNTLLDCQAAWVSDTRHDPASQPASWPPVSE